MIYILGLKVVIFSNSQLRKKSQLSDMSQKEATLWVYIKNVLFVQ
jgi:hypothetical protein